MSKKYVYIAVGVIALLLSVFLFGSDEELSDPIKVEVKRGAFDIYVAVTGELEAKESENIQAPSELRKVGVWQVQITDLIPEGTIVNEGDYVATLDRTQAATKLKDVQTELEKINSQYTTTKLDTALELRNARDELINMKYSLEEKKLVLEQSKYEPPATIRQAEIDLEKTERTYNQTLENYQLKRKQAIAKMQEVTAMLEQQQRRYDEIAELLGKFTVTAPKGGMVIYQRTWDGKKIQVGSQISAWNPVVATLPDLSEMYSKTYVNEIDISKIKSDQKVSISIDAFPDKKYEGTIIEVANIGEQLPNSDAKVFEVLIKLNKTDTILKPAMTTGNEILVAQYEDVISVPVETIFSNDTLSYVFLEDGMSIVKKEVKTGASSEDYIIVEKGINAGDIVYLSQPEDPDSYSLQRIK